VVDVRDVERVAVQRADRRALVHVDVPDAQFPAQLEVPEGHRVGELPAAGVPVPVGGVELHALEVEPLGVGAQLVQPALAVPGVEVVVVGQLVRVRRGERRRLVGLAEPVGVELLEPGRLEDGVVDVPVGEEVLHQAFTALVQVLLVGPHLGLRAEVAVVVVEAVDELLAVHVQLVLRAGVPERDVRVHDEVLLAVLAVHGSSSTGRLVGCELDHTPGTLGALATGGRG
jgi:hypothetical protein